MANEPPRIIVYARVIDNIYDNQIEPFVNVRDKRGIFDFGRIGMTSGGESQNIVEFDIWNNEPSFSAGSLSLTNEPATNCNFTVWEDSKCTSYLALRDDLAGPNDPKPAYFVRARGIIDNDYNRPFVSIGGPNGLPADQLMGNVSRSAGVLDGSSGGDHVKIQTKIVVAKGNGPEIINFVFSFTYNFG